MKSIKALALVCFLTMVGCAPTITFTPDGGLVTAKDYAIKETVKDGKIITRTYVPKPSWSQAIIKSILEQFGTFAEMAK